MVVGCQPYAPAAFIPRKCSWYSFMLGAELTPGPSLLYVFYRIHLVSSKVGKLLKQGHLKWNSLYFKFRRHKFYVLSPSDKNLFTPCWLIHYLVISFTPIYCQTTSDYCQYQQCVPHTSRRSHILK
jgi:hypothetical protein